MENYFPTIYLFFFNLLFLGILVFLLKNVYKLLKIFNGPKNLASSDFKNRLAVILKLNDNKLEQYFEKIRAIIIFNQIHLDEITQKIVLKKIFINNFKEKKLSIKVYTKIILSTL